MKAFLLVILATALIVLPGCGKKERTVNNDRNKDFFQFHDINSASEKIKEAASAVVMIGFNNNAGTGFFISEDGLLVTNNHVLGYDTCSRQGCPADLSVNLQKDAKNYKSETVYLEPLYTLQYEDITVAQVWTSEEKKEKYAAEHAIKVNFTDGRDLVGKKIYAVGHPKSGLKKWSDGTVFSSSGNGKIESDTEVLPGSSGSPALNENGEAIGIIHRSGGDGPSSMTKKGYSAESYLTSLAVLGDEQKISSIANGSLKNSGDMTSLYDSKAPITDEVLNEVFDAIMQSEVFEGKDLNDPAVFASFFERSTKICDAALDQAEKTQVYTDVSVSCDRLLDQIACDPDEAEFYGVYCPTDKAAWSKRFKRMIPVAKKTRGDFLNVSVDMPLKLEVSNNAEETRLSAVNNLLREYNTDMTVELLLYLAGNIKASYSLNGSTLLDYLKQYTNDQTLIESDGTSLVYAWQIFRFTNQISEEEFKSNIRKIMSSENITIADYFLCEKTIFLSEQSKN